MNYGLPYMGSKNGIAEWVISKLPKADNLYDLFCGGGAVTHASLLTNKFKRTYMNDINPAAVLFIEAAKGKFHNENRWISREDFFKLKDKEPYVAYVWSFGNSMKGYLYNESNERIKKALWFAVVFNDYSLAEQMNIPFKKSTLKDTKQRRLDIMRHWKKYGIKQIRNEHKKAVLQKGLQRGLQSLESLERLQRLQSLEFSNKSYNQVEIQPNSVIYCDIPYRGTATYTANENGFNHEAFYKWAKSQKELVVISEYSMPAGFTCIAKCTKRNTLSATANTKAIEKLFVPDNQIELYNQMMNNERETL